MSNPYPVKQLSFRGDNNQSFAILRIRQVGPLSCRWRITLKEPGGRDRLEIKETISDPYDDVDNITTVHLDQSPPSTRFRFLREHTNNQLIFEFVIKLKNSRNSATQVAVLNSFVQTFMDDTRQNPM